MKRNILYLTLLTVGLLASCSKDSDGPVEPEGPVDATITLSVFSGTKPSGTKAATKADDTDGQVVGNEARINNLQIAIFKADGSLLAAHYEDYSGVAGTVLRDTIGVSAKSGDYKLVVLANTGNINYTTLNELKEKTTELSTQSSDNLSMSSKCIAIKVAAGENYIGPSDGFGNKVMTGYHQISQERIKVTRLVGRIDLESLEVDWSDDTSADLIAEQAGFKLKKIYIRAAKKESRVISGSETPSIAAADWDLVEWAGVPSLHGKRGVENYLESLDLFFDETGENIAYHGTKDFAPLSCYVTENGNKADIPDPTRIIIVGDITDNTGETILADRHYTIIVNDKDGNSQITGGGLDSGFSYIRRNYVYHVSATITGKGSPDEERYNNASITSLVQAVPWQVIYEDHTDVN